MTARTTCPGSSVASTNFGIAIRVGERVELAASVATSGGPALSPRRALRPSDDVRLEAVETRVATPTSARLVQAVHHRAVRRVDSRVLRHEDELLERDVLRGTRSRARRHVCGIRWRQHSCRNGRYVFGPPSRSTLCRSVLPRVRTERFCITIASASEHRISFDGDAGLDEVDDVGLGEDAALRGDVVELRVVEVERPPSRTAACRP